MAAIVQMFEGEAEGSEPGSNPASGPGSGSGRPVRDREAELARLRLLISETGTVPARFAGAGARARGGSAGSAIAGGSGGAVAVAAAGAAAPAVAPGAAGVPAAGLATPATTAPPATDADADIPVLPGLRSLLPDGVLRRGTVVALEDRVRPWSETPSYLALALAAGATADGAWCGVVGLPAFGIAAAAGLGADLRRMLLLDEPGERWAEAVAVLAGAVDLILLRPPGRPTGEHVRRITARLRQTARQRGAALVVTGEWAGAALRLRTTRAVWSGLGAGTGHLTGRRVTVAAEGRGLGGRTREADLWLPAADGTVRTATEVAATTATTAAGSGTPRDRDERPAIRTEVTAEIREGGTVIPLRSA